MKTILLQRLAEYENVTKPPKNGKTFKPEGATIGIVEVLDEEGKRLFSCYSVENAGPSTDTPNLDKRIVAREYKLYYTSSSVALPQSFKKQVLSLYTDELPSFKERRIHIHIGNYPQDTEGCILLNALNNGDGTGSQSTKAIEDFYRLVKKYGVEDFRLIIKEIKE